MEGKDVRGLDQDRKSASRTILLETKEGEYSVSVPFHAAIMSGLVRTAFEGENADTSFPVNMQDPMLVLIGEYLLHMDGVAPTLPPVPVPYKQPQVEGWVKDPWLASWLRNIQQNLPRWQMIDLIRQANYMDIPCLLQYACALFVATTIPLEGNSVQTHMQPSFVQKEYDKKQKNATTDSASASTAADSATGASDVISQLKICTSRETEETKTKDKPDSIGDEPKVKKQKL